MKNSTPNKTRTTRGGGFPIVRSLLLFLALFCLISAGLKEVRVSAASTLNVPGSYPTIQAALNAAAPGDTIVLAAGTYTENIVINTRVTLQGAGSGVSGSVIQSAVANTPVITFNVGGTSATDRMILKDVRVRGANGSSGNSGSGIILLPGVTGYLTLDNVSVVENSGNGLSIDLLDVLNDILIRNSTFSQNGGSGFRAPASSAGLIGLEIANSHFDSNIGGGFTAYSVTLKGWNIHNSTFNDNIGANVPFVGGYGLYIEGHIVQDITIDCSEFSRNRGTADQNANISSGLVLLPASAGDLYTNINISHSQFVQNPFAGVLLQPALGAVMQNLTLECDAFKQNGYGILNFDAGTVSGLSIHDSNFDGNTTAGLENDNAAVIDARSNWWGSASGPNAVGNPGMGDAIINGGSGSVLFMPFRTTPSACPAACIPLPAVAIIKKTNGTDNDAAPGPTVLVGSTVNWTYLVTNTGTVPLTNVVVTDDQGVTVTCPANTLADGESMTCTASGTAVAGQYTNIGSVTGKPPTGPNVTASNPDHYFGQVPCVAPAFNFTGGTSATTGTAGNIRTFTASGVSVHASAFGETKPTSGTHVFSAAYLGHYSLGLGVTDSSENGANNTHVTDNNGQNNYVMLEFSQSVAVDRAYLDFIVGDSDVKVWIGTIPNAYTTHQNLNAALLSSLGFSEVNLGGSSARWADINAGLLSGNVFVIAAKTDETDDGFKLSKLETACGSGPRITILKKTNGTDNDAAPGPIVPVGSTVTWTYLVTNNGSVPLTNVTVNDDKVGAISCPATTLAIGANMTCTKTSTAVAGQYTNIGTATGTPPSGPSVTASNPDNYFGSAAAISILKKTNGTNNDVAPGPTVAVGSTVTWTYLVTNTGNVPLTGVAVTDNKVGAISCPATTLAVGASMTCTKTGTAVAGQYTNIGTVTGTPPAGSNVTASNPDNYFGQAPCPATGTLSFTGSTATSGAAGNIKTFSVGSVNVHASAFSRVRSGGAWNTAYLGAYSGGLGVTDGSEGDGSSDRHKIDNIGGRDNYVLLEFSTPVVIDRAFLDVVGADSDVSVWIGTKTNPYTTHITLSDATLSSFYTEENSTADVTPGSRWADLNVTQRSGNVVVIAALTSDSSPEDAFKLSKLELGCPAPPICSASTFAFSGNTATSGTAGNIRTFALNGVTVNVSAFSRADSNGAWAPAYLGLYSGGLGVTDTSEGDGSNNMHKVDNVGGRNNYVLFEFSAPVVIDQAYLDIIGADSDISTWIGTVPDTMTAHLTLSDAVLAYGIREDNTGGTAPRWAKINAGNVTANALVISALAGDAAHNDEFKISKLGIKCQ
jgi:hypothetical protein